jgi:hypothetical protein
METKFKMLGGTVHVPVPLGYLDNFRQIQIIDKQTEMPIYGYNNFLLGCCTTNGIASIIIRLRSSHKQANSTYSNANNAAHKSQT